MAMPRARHRWRTVLLYAAGAASLVLMLATILAWAWLGRYERSIAYATANAQVQVGAFPSAIVIDRSVVTWMLHPEWRTRTGSFSIRVDRDEVGAELGKRVRLYHFAGAALRTVTWTFRNETGGAPHKRTAVGIWVPYWLVLLLTLPTPLWIMTDHRRRLIRAARRERGLCEQCGYDLRATPGRCPECGTPAAAQRSLLARLTLLLKGKVGRAGIEPATHGFSVHCSTS